MHELPGKLRDKLNQRKEENALRRLVRQDNLVDFVSNDYLGFANSDTLYRETNCFLEDQQIQRSGSTGSRLLSGNQELIELTEKKVASFHGTDAALIFNSGYDANIGFFASVPQRGDLILYDEYSHASIRDGIRMSQARDYKYKHNDLNHLQELIERHTDQTTTQKGIVYVVTESVFSMDGDSPDLIAMADLCSEYNCLLVVDEAHAVGLFGDRRGGLVEKLNLHSQVFARIVTFGKALGVHGAAILGSLELKEYLVNFARSFIYTTAMTPHSTGSVYVAYKKLESEYGAEAQKQLLVNISTFIARLKTLEIDNHFTDSYSAIQSCIIPGNTEVKKISQFLMEQGFDVRPILHPTVPRSEERLRFSIHSFNKEDEINAVLLHLSKYLSRL